jgi:hypothetical protein
MNLYEYVRSQPVQSIDPGGTGKLPLPGPLDLAICLAEVWGKGFWGILGKGATRFVQNVKACEKIAAYCAKKQTEGGQRKETRRGALYFKTDYVGDARLVSNFVKCMIRQSLPPGAPSPDVKADVEFRVGGTLRYRCVGKEKCVIRWDFIPTVWATMTVKDKDGETATKEMSHVIRDQRTTGRCLSKAPDRSGENVPSAVSQCCSGN